MLASRTSLLLFLVGPAYSLPLIKEHNKHGPVNSEDDLFEFLMMVSIIFGGLVIALIGAGVILLVRFLINRKKSIRLENSVPGSIDDEFEIEERLAELSPNEQHLYRAGQEYIKQNPPIDTEISLSNHLVIQEKGVDAWEFIPDMNLEHDAITINNKTELNFNNYDYQCSIQSNLPIPKINDVYYFEAKLFQIDSPSDSIVSIGLSTRPYPYFRLPGRHLYSVAYDSNGSRRVNNSFKLTESEMNVFPTLEKGDVVGVGYRVRSGTIFFTRNGKKVSEKSIGGHIKGMRMPNLFPTVGSNNPCCVQVNLGQFGYVFIEANIKKWGYASKDGNRPPLPEYGLTANDLLLESSNEDDEDEIINPPDFYENAGYSSNTSSIVNDNITLNTLPSEPPRYYEKHGDEEHLLRENTSKNQFLTELYTGDVHLNADDGEDEEEGEQEENEEMGDYEAHYF